MDKFATQRRCVVCGLLLPTMSQEALINKGCGIRKGDGSVIWHCGRHQPVEVLSTMDGVPKFRIAKKES